MNRKGFVFTFISVILVSVILLAFLVQYSMRTRGTIERTNTEIETMNSFVESLNEKYLSRALQVSTNQAVLALLNCMDPEVECDYVAEGEYLDNSKIRIENVLYSGKFNNDNADPMVLMEIEGESYNLTSTLDEIVTLANYTGINFNYEINIGGISISQNDPWNIKALMIISYGVSNKKGDTSWTYTGEIIQADVPLINFRDPIHMIEGGANVNVNETPFILPNEIDEHVMFTNYVQCDQAPNFLTRMKGLGEDWNPGDDTGTGIESIVNARVEDESSIDYQYYNLEEEENAIPIEYGNGPPWYYIDSTHTGCYNIL